MSDIELGYTAVVAAVAFGTVILSAMLGVVKQTWQSRIVLALCILGGIGAADFLKSRIDQKAAEQNLTNDLAALDKRIRSVNERIAGLNTTIDGLNMSLEKTGVQVGLIEKQINELPNQTRGQIADVLVSIAKFKTDIDAGAKRMANFWRCQEADRTRLATAYPPTPCKY